MTITKEIKKRSLTLDIADGTDTDGQPVYKSKTFNSVDPAAAEADVHAVGAAIAELIDGEVDAVCVNEKSELVEA